MKLKILAAIISCVTMFSVISIPAFAETSEVSIPVEVQPTAATFSVSVPTQLAIAVDAEGNVSTSTATPTITNYSDAAVCISDVWVNSSEFTIVDWDWMESSYSDLAVNTTCLALKINDMDAYWLDSWYFYPDEDHSYISKDKYIEFSYDALVTTQTSEDEIEMANIIFVFDWCYQAPQQVLSLLG